MLEKTYRLLLLFDALTEVRGRKKLQKTVFMMQISGFHMMCHYDYHYYGPYSADLQSELDDLVAQGLLIERQEGGAFTYSISRKGKEFKEKWEAHAGTLDDTGLPVSLVETLNQQSSPFLELLSTYAYLLQQDYTGEQAYQKAQELKPHLAAQMDEAVEFYQSFLDGTGSSLKTGRRPAK